MKVITSETVYAVSFPNGDGIGGHFGYFVNKEDAEFVAKLPKGAWGETGYVRPEAALFNCFESVEEAGIDRQKEIDRIKAKLTKEEKALLGIN